MKAKEAQTSSVSALHQRRRLQWTLGVLAGVAAASSSSQVIAGSRAVPGAVAELEPSVDSALRYASTYVSTVGPVIWSQLRRVEQRSPWLTWALTTISLGGLARLRSWQKTGRPHPTIVLATVVETCAAPALLLWHRRVSTQH
jgi:hypothetical protein